VHHEVMLAKFDKAAKDAVEAEDLTLEGQSMWTARVSPKTSARPGRTIELAIDPGAFHFFDSDSGQAIGHRAPGDGGRAAEHARTESA
jgi:multiple sugar transport system ATP-binding protein